MVLADVGSAAGPGRSLGYLQPLSNYYSTLNLPVLEVAEAALGVTP